MITPIWCTDRIGQPRWSFQHVGLSGRASIHGWIGNTFRIFNRVAHPTRETGTGGEEKKREREKETRGRRAKENERE